MADNHVRPVEPKTRADVSGKLAAGWARVSAGRKGGLADMLGCDTKTVNRALTGETLPELHTAFNSLAFDPTALDEVVKLYGFSLVMRRPVATGDMDLMAGLGRSLSELIERLRDGKRCHLDTLAIAELFRPLIPQMQAVVDQAEAIRS